MSRPNDGSKASVPFYSYDRLRNDYSWRQGFSYLFLPCAFVLLAVEAANNAPPLLIFLSFLGLSALFTALVVIVLRKR